MEMLAGCDAPHSAGDILKEMTVFSELIFPLRSPPFATPPQATTCWMVAGKKVRFPDAEPGLGNLPESVPDIQVYSSDFIGQKHLIAGFHCHR